MESAVKKRILAICDELGEEMDSPACKKLHEYVRACPDCKAFVDSVKKTIKLYQTYTPKYPHAMRQRLFQKLELE